MLPLSPAVGGTGGLARLLTTLVGAGNLVWTVIGTPRFRWYALAESSAAAGNRARRTGRSRVAVVARVPPVSAWKTCHLALSEEFGQAWHAR